jgi:putative ABC transport system ATP-binding protein
MVAMGKNTRHFTGEDMLEFKDVTIRRASRTILDKVSLTISPGEHLILTGPSGSGKSTLLRAALLFEPVDQGEVLWDGQKIFPADLAAHRSRFLYIGQKPMPFDGTGEEYLNLPFTFAANHHLRPDKAGQDRLMESLGLDPALKNTPYMRLSGGEQQRLTIIQGLQLERGFCLLDEVTSSLDQESMRAVIRHFSEDKDRTVLAVAHNTEWLDFGFAELYLEYGKIRRRE